MHVDAARITQRSPPSSSVITVVIRGWVNLQRPVALPLPAPANLHLMRGGQRARICARHPTLVWYGRIRFTTTGASVKACSGDRSVGLQQRVDQPSVDVGEVAMQHPSRIKS